MKRNKGKVVVGMSGGVDSSVAAGLLRDEGYEVVGCYMRLWCEGRGLGDGGYMEEAKAAAEVLGVEFAVLDLRSEFERVIEYFVDEYNAGRTPNPCVRCNSWLKFAGLVGYADEVGAACVATGHYARVRRVGGNVGLYRGVDEGKDQSYVLFG